MVGRFGRGMQCGDPKGRGEPLDRTEADGIFGIEEGGITALGMFGRLGPLLA